MSPASERSTHPTDPGAAPPSPPAVGPEDAEGPSLGELFAQISRDLSMLVRQEVELARAEAMAAAKRMGRGAGMVGGAGYAGGMAVFFLSLALWWALGTVLGFGWSALVVAGVWAVVAVVLAVRGRDEMTTSRGMTGTVDSLKKIPNALRGHEEENR